jgi:hypothetical protein
MNSNRASNNSRFLNSLLPLNSNSVVSGSNATNTQSSWKNWFGKSNASNATNATSSVSMTGIVIFVLFVGIFISVMVLFKKQITDTWNNTKEVVTGYFDGKKAPPVVSEPPADASVSGPASGASQSVIEKILPGGGSEVFNVSSNKYTYYDAEPLCKALGAELATYEQVKDAWAKGADWCNYGWVKGQLAVYPTGDETYKKLQGGPEEQRMACGQPGLNGGYFDNPELRFGVTCVGKKPPQSKNDEAAAAAGAPISPDAMAFDKKVSQFKSEADQIGILPFNSKGWTG